MKNLDNIKNILFDCDGVLYSDLEAVFGQVSRKMTEYISSKLNVDLKKAKERGATVNFSALGIVTKIDKNSEQMIVLKL